jgi:ankyrin repeat protein
MDEILIAAAASGDATLCSRVLKDDANVNFTSIYFGRAIHAAVSRGHEQSVRLLLEQKDLEVNVSDTFRIQTPLVMAAMQGQESAVNLLLNIREDIELGAEDIYGYTALGWACTKGHEGIVKLLLDREDIKADQPGKDHETPLYKAARYGYEAIVRLLLARGDVNPGHRTPWGETAIFIAASSGRESIVRLLLDQKDVDPVSQMPGGETPLLAAASRREPDHSTFELVRLFLARADVNGAHRDKFGRDAFFLAGRSGSVLMMKMLLDKYKLFDPNLRNFSGRTVLHHLADAYGKDGVLHSAAPISYLLERSDVDINIEDKEGRTPLRCAIKADNQPLVQLISERLDRGQQNPMLSENA